MFNRVILIGFCVMISDVTTQALDNVPPPNPVIIQEPKPSTSTATDSKWDELMPALQSLKNNSIKKERLYNIVKIIKFLLATDNEDKSERKKIIEVIKEKIKEPEDKFPGPTVPHFDNIVEERLNSVEEVIDDKSYILDKNKEKNNTKIKDTPAPKNKIADFSKIQAKIDIALAKLKDQNQDSEIQTPKLVPIFRPTNCGKKQNDFNPTLYENPKQLGNLVSGQTVMNPITSQSMFNIPCQRASDILEETANFPLPRDIFCNNPAVNLNSLAKNAKLNLDDLPFENIVPNSITCVDSDDSIAILFKPKTISLMQLYGNLLKKITMTVLVPYYVSKLAL